MALKTVLVADVPERPAVALPITRLQPKGMVEMGRGASGFVVVGHRGKGMNALASSDRRLMAVKENSVRSFNAAAQFPIDFIEFDVQVTKDDWAVIFHDNFILTEEDGNIDEKRVTDLTLEEFLSYGPQKEIGKMGKTLLRKAKDGRVLNWNVEDDDSLCTLQEAFQKVDSHLGFNIELKFDDDITYKEEELTHALEVILQVVSHHANARPIIFSSFHPDAAQLMRKLQSAYPVFFLTDGGCEVYNDIRRNSLDEAIKLCLASGLQGIVSEARGIFRNPSAISRMKESNLHILTYGQLNNVPEAVYMQHLMGINGVIVDLIEEITGVVSEFTSPAIRVDENLSKSTVEEEQANKPNFSQLELAFLLRLIPQLVQH
ncbi:Glycerophosphodiester phosphodiesterase protein [Dioscorea alata]|uniref:Glycerophosphodiester phosphodiesterase protein n=1 Tax=Dioscorea alata TaxID=55571 RepID=A0ACB7UTK1_DIOAL|nr:Glycerophosphodiester phosphodiesterase protein [Dioscorea alata]